MFVTLPFMFDDVAYPPITEAKGASKNHGIFASQMRNYLDYVRTSGKCKSKYVPIGEDGLEISVKL